MASWYDILPGFRPMGDSSGILPIPNSFLPIGYVESQKVDTESHYYYKIGQYTPKEDQYSDVSPQYQVTHWAFVYKDNESADESFQHGYNNCISSKNRESTDVCKLMMLGNNEAYISWYVTFSTHSNNLYITIKKGSLITSMQVYGHQRSKTFGRKHRIVYAEPSYSDVVNTALVWHNALLNYAKSSGWKSETEESTSIPDQLITLPKTTLSADLSANQELQEEPEQEEYLDEAMIEYRKKEKERIAREKAEDMEDLAQEKEQEAQEKADEEYQAMLDKWYEEVRQDNIKHNKELEKGKARREAIEEQENQAFHDKLAKDMQKRKEFQAKQQKNIKLINRFAPADEWSDAYQHIKKIDKTGDIKKSKKLFSDNKENYYNSWREKRMKESEVLDKRVEKFEKAFKSAEFIRDTAVTVNKILALPAIAQVAVGTTVLEGAVSKKIVTTVIPFVHGATTNAIVAAGKEGWGGAGASLLKDSVDEVTFKLGGGVVDKGVRVIKFYYGDGIEVSPKMKVYDENHKLLKKVKKGDKVYDDKGNNITYATTMRLMRYKWFVDQAQKDLSTGDANKKANALLDIWGLGISGTEKVLEIGKRFMK